MLYSIDNIRNEKRGLAQLTPTSSLSPNTTYISLGFKKTAHAVIKFIKSGNLRYVDKIT